MIPEVSAEKILLPAWQADSAFLALSVAETQARHAGDPSVADMWLGKLRLFRESMLNAHFPDPVGRLCSMDRLGTIT